MTKALGKGSKPVRHVTDPNLIAIAHLVRLLQDNTTLDNRALAEECGLNYLTVCRYTAAFRQVKAARIVRWKEDPRGAPTIRVFALGGGPDARPLVETPAQKMRRMRKQWKAERTETGIIVRTG